MKKNYIYALFFSLLSSLMWAQTTETFETETNNATSFTDNGQVFNITSQAPGNFIIQGAYPGTGWNGTAADNKYIDNSGTAFTNTLVTFTVSSAGAVPFKVNSMWLYLANASANVNVTGSLTITGKLAGVTKFTATAGSGFNTNVGVNNGFSLINMTTFGGANNSTIAIDQFVISTGGNFFYVALDALTWTTIPALTATQSQVNLTCNGVCTGQASVVASGGTAPYTYAWSPSGGSGATASSLCATNYTCTITDAALATLTKTFTITQPSAIAVIPVSQTNVACFGGSSGAASVSASGGTGTLTYNWTPGNPTGDGTASVTGLTAGSWTCTVTDANSCTKSQTFNVTQPTALAASTAQTNVSCFGGSNGSTSVSVSGGTGAYTYAWSPSGGTAATASGLTAGTYTCTITDANSCTLTKAFTVTQPIALAASTAQTNISCFGGSNGSTSVSVSGGTGAYTYAWSPSGGTAATASGLTAGTYTCTITDANSCTLTKAFTLTQPTAIVVLPASQTNIACNGGSNGAASINTPTGGAGGYTYNWTPGNPTGDGTTSVSGLTAGSWTCTVTDANACTKAQVFTITQPTALTATTSQTNIACNGGATGKASVSASGGTGSYTYAWSPSGGTAATATGLSATNYTCTITDANSCTLTKAFTLTQPTALLVSATANNATVCTGGSSTLTANGSGGTGVITYAWVSGPANNVSVVTPTATTIYTVNATDGNSCSNSATVSVVANNCTPAAALNFDGLNDYVTIPYAETTTNITHEFWFKTTQANQGLFSITDVNPAPGGFDRDLYLTGGNINAYVWQNTSSEVITTAGTNYADGNWHHVAHVIGASVSGQRLYVDGVLKASGIASFSAFNWNTKVLVGFSATSPSNNYFNGSIDEVRIWNVARTQCEINTYKNCEIPTTAAGLVANYHFNQGFNAATNTTVTALTDVSGNTHTGALTNFALSGTTSNWVAPGGVVSGSITPANLTITVGSTVSNSVICLGNSTTLSGTGADTYNWTGGVINATAFSPTVTATYTVTGTNTLTGCFNTAVNTVTVNTCPPAAALNFDGVNDHVDLGNGITTSLTGSTKVSVEAWVKPTSLTGLGCIVGNYNTGTGGLQILLRRNTSFYEFWIGNGGSWYNTNSVATPSLNTWQHVAATWDGTIASIYVNGVLSGTTTPAITTLGNAYNSPVWLGSNVLNESFAGNIDEARIWNVARTQCEINTYKNCEIPTTAAGLLANYHFNQGFDGGTNTTVTTLTDASGSANTGTVTSFALSGATSNWVAPGGVVSGSITPANLTITVGSTVSNSVICSGNSTTLSGTGADAYSWTNGVTNAAAFSPTVTATYTVTGTNTVTGCSNTATNTVTVNTLPTISVNSGSICSGQSFTMTPGGASTYTYSSGSAVVTPTTNASYNVTGTDANGCVSSNTAVSTVTVNALPTITVSSGAICAGQSYTIIANGASTYSSVPVLAGPVVTPTATTNYSITGTDANGCVSSNTAVSSVTVNTLPTISVNSGAICTGNSFTMTPNGATTYTYSSGSAVVTPTTNATYNVTGTDANGCVSSNTAVSTVTVNVLPTISVNSGSICAGQSFTMTPSGASTYTYSSGSAVVTPTANVSYNVTGTDANGCISSSAAVSTVTVNALPMVMATTNNTLLCTGHTATLSVTGATSYTWNTTATTSVIAVSPTITTIYTVTGTDANGCVNTMTVQQDVSLCTDIQSAISNQPLFISVYPNPTGGLINIELEIVSGNNASIQILNTLGEVLVNESVNTQHAVLNIQHFTTGVYFVKVIQQGKQQIIKLIKD